MADGKRWTYAALADRVGRMAAVLRRRGFGPGDALAILSHNRADVLVVYLAAMVEGLRLTPISAGSSTDDQVFILDDAQIDVLIADATLSAHAEAWRSGAPRLRAILTLGPAEGLPDLSAETDAEPPAPLAVKPIGEAISMIYYTGGTTGRPKGVAHTHASAMATVLIATSEWDWPEEMRVLATTPVSHAGGAFAWPTFLKGGAFHVLPGFSPRAFADYVAAEQITVTFMVPTMIYRLLDEPGLEVAKLKSLETIVYGAAPIAVPRLAEAIGRFGPVFMQLYGQTEAPNCVAYLAKSEHRLDAPGALASCGVPLGPVQVELQDPGGAAVAPGELGEICVRGALVMQGYWRRPQETAEAFAGGWLHTGDIGRFDEGGRLHIVDRKKDMIISGGFNVYPGEIEAVLNTHPAVAASAVVGLPDPLWGEAVTALVVRRPAAPVEAAELLALVRERKGAVMTPKRLAFVDDLPVTAIGKIDKKALRANLAARLGPDG